jgi:hypothetical protein
MQGQRWIGSAPCSSDTQLWFPVIGPGGEQHLLLGGRGSSSEHQFLVPIPMHPNTGCCGDGGTTSGVPIKASYLNM